MKYRCNSGIVGVNIVVDIGKYNYISTSYISQ